MDNKAEYTGTKERIIDATLQIIGSEGIYRVTVRKIACLAGVNVAAVNYHFGSKDLLINEALKSITQQLKGSFQYLEQEEILPEERLRNFLVNYAATLVKYPDILKNFMMQSINDFPDSGEYEEYLKTSGFLLLKKNIIEMRPESSDLAVGMKVMQMLGSMAFPVLVANRIFPVEDMNYLNSEIRNLYVEMVLRNLIQ